MLRRPRRLSWSSSTPPATSSGSRSSRWPAEARSTPDTFVGEPSYRAALHAAGGACEMTRALMAGEAALGFCGVRPSGHHAEPDRAMGFCLFNNVALAAELAIRELGARRVFILDWDVHHGNGTAEAFRRRSDILFASIHQSGIYPGQRAR